MSGARPPRLAERILARGLPRGERDVVLGDLRENFADRCRLADRHRAALWYWRHALAVPLRIAWGRRSALRLELGELRYAARGLAASPAFTVVAILSLGLGIGANTAVFSTIRSVLFTTLPVERPQELRLAYHARPDGVQVQQYSSSQAEDPGAGVVHSNYSLPMVEAIRAAVESSGVAAASGRAVVEPSSASGQAAAEVAAFNFVRSVSVVYGERPAVVASALMASGNYFATLGLPMALGRPLTELDDRPGAEPAAVISDMFWRSAFAGDPSVIERTALINGTEFRIVGVTPPRYVGLSPGGFFPPTDVTVSLAAQPIVAPDWAEGAAPLSASHERLWLRLIARVPEGVDDGPLGEAMSAAARGVFLTSRLVEPADADRVEVVLLPGERGLDSVRARMVQPLRILAIVAAGVLLIACANLASLMLGRGAARQRDLAVRRALGAGRARLIRQLLLESLLVAAGGGVLGLVIALWGGPLITSGVTAGIGRVVVLFQLDRELLAITAAVSTAAALLFGVLPAVRLTRRDASEQLRARTAGSGERSLLGRVLIAAQIALSIPVIVGAGLFLQTVANLASVDPGFDPRGLVLFRIDPALEGRDPDRVAAVYREALGNLEAIPGVTSASLVENSLLSGLTSSAAVTIDGERVQLYMNAIGPRIFETLRVPVVAGRSIDDGDTASSAPVVVVNEAAAQAHFGGNAVGQRFLLGDREVEIVGVVGDTKYRSLRADVPPTFFDPYQQRGSTWRGMEVVLRASGPVAPIEPAIRDAVSRADRNLPVIDLRTQTEQIRDGVGREQVFARLLTLFGGFAVLVACIGLHGVTAFSVQRRTGEIGVRLAMGARRDQIQWLVLRRVLGLAAVGSAAGLVGAAFVVRIVESMLFGLEPTDAATSAGAVALMAVVAIAAGWVPAYRASRTDAVAALTRD